MKTAEETFQNFTKCLEFLREFHDVKTNTDAPVDFGFEIPRSLRLTYETFPDVECFCGQDFMRSVPSKLGSDWWGQPIESGLIEIAFENQAVWIMATHASDCLDGPVFIVDDEKVVQHESLNSYLAGFLLNQSVWNGQLKKTRHIQSTRLYGIRIISTRWLPVGQG